MAGLNACLNALSGLSLTSPGAASLAASSATAPYVVVRLLDAWVITPSTTVHSLGTTFQRDAAA